MNKQITKAITSLFTLILCSACSPELVKSPSALVLDKVGRIELQIESKDLPATQEELGKQVSKNLSDWGYPIGAEPSQAISHILTATVDDIVHGSTPTGFSFSAGNSDPRAMDFQKANVLPIHCQLQSVAYPEQSNALDMGFSASRQQATTELADHISTVCFNLLRAVNWPKPAQGKAPSSMKPAWIPEVQIENKPSKSLDTPTPSTEPRQQIIINNQGSPVILHFGHERR